VRFTVCIPTTRSTTLAAAVVSVCRQTFTDWELIVVGQGDEAELSGTVASAADGDERVRYLHIDRRGGSIARNAGIAAGTGELIALLDDDCEAASDWLAVLDEYFTRTDAGLVGGSLVAPLTDRRLSTCPENIVRELKYDPSSTGRVAPPGWGMAAGGNIAVRRSNYDVVGIFDEYLGAGADFGGSEESDYSLRLESAGITMMTTPRSVVHHTYGHRYGLGAIYRHKRNYARGYGALAAKRTMLGDERGLEWKRAIRDETVSRLSPKRLRSLPSGAFRYWHFRRAFRQCLLHYRVDPEHNLVRAVLQPRHA
jgi:glycosyltransferase involved in cell wall biosynthesis